MTGRLEKDRRTRDESGVVAPSRVMLVAIVLVAVAAVTYIAGLGSGTDQAEVASTTSSRSTASSAPADPSSSATPSASASPSATSTPTRKPSAKASAKASAQPSRQASGQTSGAAPSVQRGQVRVSVFNNSSRTGLAARTSQKVESAGWKVIGTDNWYGTIPQPTVYYPARLKAAADLLAKDAGIDRVKPAVTPMRSDRLTLIVTGDYTA